ncbi:MAG: twin-arginine translocase TatA/TatE family subunit [Candidatus Eremiobacteraeota bacterium]|nr:twin-arginine translocase TatA/TatE family subunit [Candidatus Eremiobacteraeota bacterium]
MKFEPILAIWSPEIIGILVLGAVILFGADRLPKLARSAGQAKKEFLVGQAEADAAEAKAREDARLRAERARMDPMSEVAENSGFGQQVPPPEPGQGTNSV